MRALLLGLAAIGAVGSSAPAPAQESSAAAFAGVPAVNVHRGVSGDRFDRRDGRRFRRGGDSLLVLDRDYQGDTLWRPDSFNDWWHDRPDRSMPRWVRNNQNCERMWWSGGGWRC